MLIQCSSCGAQAKLPDNKEGAKVKCPSCAHVYVARPAGRGGARAKKDDPTKYFVIGGVLLGAVVLAILASGGKKELPKASEKPVEEQVASKPYVDPLSWEGPTVALARSLHQAAVAGNRDRLLATLEPVLAYDYELPEPMRGAENPSAALSQPPAGAGAEESEAGASADGEGEAPTEAQATARPEWSSLAELEKIAYGEALVDAALTPGPEGCVKDWKPFDGKVESMQDGYSIVRLKVQSSDPDAGLIDRWTQWVFHNSAGDFGPDDAWKWVRVDRWLTAEEAAQMRAPRRKKAEKKTLSDGSVVYESEIRAIPFSDEIPAARQLALTKLVDDLVFDIDRRPGQVNDIRDELRLAGKAAVPALLTKMATIAGEMSPNTSENETERIQLNWLHEMLRDITGHETTFDVAVEMGATQERIDSGLKQWFAWYDKKFRRFEERDDTLVDPLADDPDLAPRTAEEKRRYERAKREIEEERRLEKQKRDG